MIRNEGLRGAPGMCEMLAVTAALTRARGISQIQEVVLFRRARQYSEAFVEGIVDRISNEKKFLKKTRRRFREMTVRKK
jgi:hypothetical protein